MARICQEKEEIENAKNILPNQSGYVIYFLCSGKFISVRWLQLHLHQFRHICLESACPTMMGHKFLRKVLGLKSEEYIHQINTDPHSDIFFLLIYLICFLFWLLRLPSQPQQFKTPHKRNSKAYHQCWWNL